ncbi:hypothetical protein KEU06_10770 [Pseudaminobacter sp. 19-2017]|uniref:Uncharacterized protein n=1 Tax=Pseudaminobacter soli (ex Zhang et al. 2022) TaxID=2831468 RepID=A0A942DWL7_9HYPH|nr:hypothetical protein [Pseudaminobacter soli]MBS3649089.1 hypothetical protein [Pseudaminobacter soli]
MQTNLQFQDSFQPYYANHTVQTEQISKDAATKPALTSAELRARLEACCSKLAGAIAAIEAGKH